MHDSLNAKYRKSCTEELRCACGRRSTHPATRPDVRFYRLQVTVFLYE